MIENGNRMIATATAREYTICDDCCDTAEGTLYWEDVTTSGDGESSCMWSLYDGSFRPDDIHVKARAWS